MSTKRVKSKTKRKQAIFVWSVLIPAIILFLIFSYFPFFNTVVGSFFDWNALSGRMEYAGVKNYVELAQDKILEKSIINTFNFTLVSTAFKTVFSLIIALLVSRVRKFKVFFRSVFFLPSICSILAMSFVFRFLFEPSMGTINGYLAAFGIDGPAWLLDPKIAMLSVIIFNIWKTTGFMFLVFLAGIMGIPSEIIEAAEVDGASGFKRTWRVVLPMLKPVIAFNIATQVIGALQEFTSIYGLTLQPGAFNAAPGGPMRSTTTTLIHIYEVAFKNFRFGYGSAISLVLFLIIFILTLIQLKLLYKKEEF